MLIASKGLPRTEVQGIDGLKDMPAMTTSQFMEQVRYNNAMEQELARSISQIAGIKNARVHLAAPKQSVFVRDRVPTKASVVITRAPGRTVSSANVSAIIQLVASSVPYLAPENVSVIDNFGSLMNEMLTEQPLGLTSAQLQQKQQMEDLYRTRLIQLLAPIVGEINVSAQVSMSMDFNQKKSPPKILTNATRALKHARSCTWKTAQRSKTLLAFQARSPIHRPIRRKILQQHRTRQPISPRV